MMSKCGPSEENILTSAFYVMRGMRGFVQYMRENMDRMTSASHPDEGNGRIYVNGVPVSGIGETKLNQHFSSQSATNQAPLAFEMSKASNIMGDATGALHDVHNKLCDVHSNLKALEKELNSRIGESTGCVEKRTEAHIGGPSVLSGVAQHVSSTMTTLGGNEIAHSSTMMPTLHTADLTASAKSGNLRSCCGSNCYSLYGDYEHRDAAEKSAVNGQAFPQTPRVYSNGNDPHLAAATVRGHGVVGKNYGKCTGRDVRGPQAHSTPYSTYASNSGRSKGREGGGYTSVTSETAKSRSEDPSFAMNRISVQKASMEMEPGVRKVTIGSRSMQPAAPGGRQEAIAQRYSQKGYASERATDYKSYNDLSKRQTPAEKKQQPSSRPATGTTTAASNIGLPHVLPVDERGMDESSLTVVTPITSTMGNSPTEFETCKELFHRLNSSEIKTQAPLAPTQTPVCGRDQSQFPQPPTRLRSPSGHLNVTAHYPVTAQLARREGNYVVTAHHPRDSPTRISISLADVPECWYSPSREDEKGEDTFHPNEVSVAPVSQAPVSSNSPPLISNLQRAGSPRCPQASYSLVHDRKSMAAMSVGELKSLLSSCQDSIRRSKVSIQKMQSPSNSNIDTVYPSVSQLSARRRHRSMTSQNDRRSRFDSPPQSQNSATVKALTYLPLKMSISSPPRPSMNFNYNNVSASPNVLTNMNCQGNANYIHYGHNAIENAYRDEQVCARNGDHVLCDCSESCFPNKTHQADSSPFDGRAAKASAVHANGNSVDGFGDP